jgi:hypothetical protein
MSLHHPHSGEGITDGILKILIKWRIQDKIGIITLNNASNNDKAALILKCNFQQRGNVHFNGLFFSCEVLCSYSKFGSARWFE